MEFHLISWIDLDSRRSDISCRQRTLAFPKTKTWQCHKQLMTLLRDRGRRKSVVEGERQNVQGRRKTGPKQTKRQKKRANKKQHSSGLPVKPEPAHMAAQTHSRLLHSDSYVLIPLHTMGTCQLSHASLALEQSYGHGQQVRSVHKMGTVMQRVGYMSWKRQGSEFVESEVGGETGLIRPSRRPTPDPSSSNSPS